MSLPELSKDYLKDEAEASKNSKLQVNDQKVRRPDDLQEKVKKLVAKHGSNKIYAIIALVVTINIAVLIYHRKIMKRQQDEQINLQVQSAVSQYFALSGTEM